MRYFDKYGFLLDSFNETDNGMGDSVGTMALLYFSTGDFNKYALPLFKIVKIEKNKFQLYRHPYYAENGINNTISRDHTIYWEMAMKKAISDENNFNNDITFHHIHSFLKHRKWRLSEKYSRTIDMWVWENIIWRDFIMEHEELNVFLKWFLSSKIWTYIYYLIQIPMMFITMIWNYIIRTVFGLDKTEMPMLSSQDQSFCGKETYNKYAKLLFPVYARHIAAWQLHFLPNSIGKKILQWIYLKMDVGNAVIRGLCGDGRLAVTLDIIYNPVTGYRWSTELNNTSDRYFIHSINDEIKPDAIVLRYVAKMCLMFN